MIQSQRRALIDSLSSIIMNTRDNDELDKARSFAHFLFQSSLFKNQSKPFSFYKKRWRKCVKPDYIFMLDALGKQFGDDSNAIFSLLDCLAKSSIGIAQQEESIQEEVKTIHRPTSLTESELVNDIIIFLRGGRSKLFSLNKCKFVTTTPVLDYHSMVIKQISKYLLSLEMIRNSREYFKGVIGTSIREVIDQEFAEFITEASSINPEESTLISLASFLSGKAGEHLVATSIVCASLQKLLLPSLLNSCILIQNYGYSYVKNICSRMIDIGDQIILRFIRDWTVYGYLSDQFHEFFVKKSDVKVPSDEWWNKRYVLDPNLVPKMIEGQPIVNKILSSGRALNFVRKHRSCCLSYINNFGSTAPFAVNFEQPKARRVNPESEWRGGPFDLSMVDEFSTEANESMMYMMMNIVWIPGHLRVVRDFILFARGDFATALYQNFSDEEEGDAPSLLLHAIKSITNEKAYTNSITNEILTDRIDLQKKWSFQPSAAEARITYLVNPPIDSFLNPSTLARYNLIGNFIWRIKCCETQLGYDWHMSRRIQYLDSVFKFKCRNHFILRNLMTFTLRTLIEYLSTDIILCEWNKFVQDVVDIHDFDSLVKRHQQYLSQIMKGSFQTSDFSIQMKALSKMLDSIDEFTSIHDEVKVIYSSVIDHMKRTKKIIKTDRFFKKTSDELEDISQRFKGVFGSFNEQLSTLYSLAFDDTKSLEMQQLEVRLRACAANIH